MKTRRRAPTADEYAAFYRGYVSLVPKGDIVDTLWGQLASTEALLRGLPADKADFRYQPGKWSLKEVLGHIVDTEWIFTNRALRFARGDTTELPGVDQDELMSLEPFADRTLESVLHEYHHLRTANCELFESFGRAELNRTGRASGCEFTVRALLYVIAGHERHHVAVIHAHYLRS